MSDYIDKLREIKQMVEDETITPCLIEYKTIAALEEAISLLEAEEQKKAADFVVDATGSEALHILDLLSAEAQGRLVVLPIKSYTTVWILSEFPSKRRIEKHIAGSIKTNCMDFIYYETGKATGFMADSIGKTVFLTREAAENALKEG